MTSDNDYIINSDLNYDDNIQDIEYDKCYICRDTMNNIPLLRVYITMTCSICLQEENQFMMKTCGHGFCIKCCIDINERYNKKLKYFLPDGSLSLISNINSEYIEYNRNIKPIINRAFNYNGRVVKWKRLYSTNIIILRESIDMHDNYTKYYEEWDIPPVPCRYDEAKWCQEMFWWYSTI